jgi:hypothetical protein
MSDLETFLSGSTDQPSSPLEQYELDADRERQQQLQLTKQNAVDIDPKRQAEAIKVGEKHGIPVDTAYESLDELKAKETDQVFEIFMTGAPLTKDLLADPVKGPVVFPDAKPIADIEKNLRDFVIKNPAPVEKPEPWKPFFSWGQLTPEEQQTEQLKMIRDNAEAAKGAKAKTDQARKDMEQQLTFPGAAALDNPVPTGPVNPAVVESTPAVQQELRNSTKAKENLVTSLTTPPTLTAARDVADRVARVIGGTPGRLISGGSSLLDAIFHFLPVETAPGFFDEKGTSKVTKEADAWIESVQQLFPADKARDQNMTPQVAEAFASMATFMAAGWITKAAGMGPALGSALTGMLEQANSGAKDALAHNATASQKSVATIFNALLGMTEALPVETIFGALDHAGGSAFVRFLGTLATGAATEGTQEAILQNLPANILAKMTYDPTRDVLAQVGQDFLIAAITGGTMGGALSLLQSAAQRNVDKLKELGQSSTSTQVSEIAPEILEAHIADLKQKGQAPEQVTASVEAVETLLQEIAPQELQTLYPQLVEAIIEAKATGAEVTIPTEKLATLSKLAGYDKFVEEVRVKPDEMTLVEAEKAQKEVEAFLEKFDTEQEVKDPDKSPIYQQVRDQLIAAGQAPEVAHAQARLHDAFFQTMSERVGKPAEELARRYGLTISSEMQESLGTKLEQQTPEFQKWFEGSKVVDEKGQPMVVYHGTRATFDSFQTSGRTNDLGVYVTPSRDFAESFAKDDGKVLELYARAQKVIDFSQHGAFVSDDNIRDVVEELPTEKLRKQFRKAYRDVARSRNGGDVFMFNVLEHDRGLKNALIAEGFDAVRFQDWGDGSEEDALVVFEPNQLKSIHNQGTFDPSNPNILFQSAAPLQGEPLKITGTGPGGRVLNQDLGKAFTERHNAKYGRPLDPDDPADYKVILEAVTEDYAEQSAQPDNGEAWYSDDIAEAMRLTAQIIPEVAEPKYRDLFLTMAALLSPQQKPLTNWENAVLAMQGFLKDGTIPTKKPNGKNFGVNSHTTGLQLLQHLITTKGLEEALLWVRTPVSGREMAEVRRDSGLFEEKDKLGGYLPNETNLNEVKLGIYMMGPKVGDFMQNSVGIDQNAVTVDLWMARTYNRIIGRLTDVPAGVQEAGGLADQVRGRAERENIKRLVRDAAREAGIAPSAMQAALWYFEQRLYRNHGIRSDSQNFSGAARAAVSKRGADVEGAGRSSSPPAAAAAEGVSTGDRAGGDQGGGLAPLPGAPAVADATGPDPGLVSVAETYARKAGVDYRRQGEFVQVDEKRAAKIAKAYEAMKHDPQEPRVKAAYADLIEQTMAQYKALEAAGYQFYLFDETNDPYQGNPWNAMRDIRANKRMAVFATEAGFGSGDTDLNVDDNPMLADTGLKWSYGTPNGPKKRVLANDLFRAVHDAFGHGLEGAGFRARGEENAWQAHVRLFYGDAVGAITTETRGQNSWLNYGPHGEKNRMAAVEDTVFADQKTGLMPEWTWTEGRAPDEEFRLEQQARGYITFTPARDRFKITLTEQANLSTFLHESGHFFLEVLQDVVQRGEGDAQTAKDLEALHSWLGEKGVGPISAQSHEKFARGFEAYLMEGKAPSLELRSVFAKFKAWLIFVYKRLSGLNVTLSDEVRGVMDRLLATDKAIEEARVQVGWRGKPMAQKDTGLTDAEYQAYVEAHTKAMDAQSHDADARVMLEIARELKATWKTEKAQITKDLETELAQTRGYKAWKLLESGEGLDKVRPGWSDLKIEINSVPSEWRRDARGLTAEAHQGGLPLDDVADILGFESGEQMLSLIAGARFAKRTIPAKAEQAMVEKHGRMDDSQLAIEALKAVHNKPSMDVLLTEYRALAAQAGVKIRNKGVMAMLTNAAEQRVASLTRRQMDPAKWRRAELNAAVESAKLKGMEAAVEKRKQLFAAAMVKATQDGLDRTEQIKDYLTTFLGDKRRAALGKAGDMYLDGVDQILEGIEFKNVSMKLLNKRPTLQEIVDAAIAADEPINIPDHILGRGMKNWSQMTLEDLEGVHDAVKNLWTLAKLKNTLKTKQGKMQLDKAMEQAEATAQATLGKREQPDTYNPTLRQRAVSRIRWVRAQLVKMEFLFGWLDGKADGGLLHSLMYQPIADARRQEYRMLKELNAKILDQLRDMPKEQKTRWDTKRQFMGMQLKGANIIAAALNLGNQSNKEKLLLGYGWNEQQLMAELNAFMTKADWDMVQMIWNEIDTLWPHIEKVAKGATGLAPPKVIPSPVHTPYGEYAGGYYPVVYDPTLNQRQAENQEKNANANGLFANNFLRPTLANGFTKKRTKYTAPLLLSLDVLSNHLAETVHYVTHYEAVKQADKIRSHPTFKRLVTEAMGDEFYREIRPWLQDIANNVTQRRYPELGESIMRRIRLGTSIAAMGYNVITASKQLLGIVTSLDAIGPKYWMQGVAKTWLSPSAPKNWKFALEKSGELEQLIKDFDRDVKQVQDTYSRKIAGGAKDALITHAFAIIGYAQLTVNVATWHGAFEQALKKGGTEAEAVDHADSVVRKTQSSGAIKDLANVQRSGEATKLITMFYSYLSVLYNRLEDIHRTTGGVKDLPKVGYRLAVLLIIPTMLQAAGSAAYDAAFGDDDDDEDAMPFLARVMLDSMDLAMGTIPVLRTAISFGERKGQISPVLSKAEQMQRAVDSLKDWVTEGEAPSRRELRTLVETAAILTLTPGAAVYKLADDMLGEKIADAVD